MADRRLKAKIAEILKQGKFNDPADSVYVLDGPEGNIHVVVISEKFRGRRLAKKHDLIWSDLFGQLEKAEWGRITLAKAVMPEELTRIM